MKRKLNQSHYPPLPTISSNDDNIPRYIVISGLEKIVNGKDDETEKLRPLSSYNLFQINRGLEHISKEILEVKSMRSGDLLVKVANLQTASKFMKQNYIDSIPVKITPHNSLNSVQGRIFSHHIRDISEEELLSELQPQKIIQIKKMFKKINNELIPTGAAILTFDLIRRPNEIKLGWLNCKVEEYIANPMRCIICQKLGHTKNRCTNAEVCKECCLPPPHDECSRIYCINCQEDSHTSYDASCPTFLRHKSVNKIKSDRRCNLREAWEIYRDDPAQHQLPAPTKKTDPKPSMAEIIKNRILREQSPKDQNNLPENQPSTSKSYQPPIPIRLNLISTEKSFPQDNNTITKLNSNNPTLTTQTTNNQPEQVNNLSNKPAITTRTTITPNNTETQNQPQKQDSHSNTNSSASDSPLSHVTKTLLKENNYYVNVMDDDDH
ncbi:uncharacterized protein LOC129945161 [Eupeodes corollae]|uniref:uncharacterized protein LOC129945161 n=1 Tax=Eupeodes corollae TaxID=290404 RepID=UPI00249252DF|nr:uncharacterized protein LOC129945161 [Eupeodes corollae]